MTNVLDWDIEENDLQLWYNIHFRNNTHAKSMNPFIPPAMGQRIPLNNPRRLISHKIGGARGVMVIVVGNGHGDMSSNPGRDWFHIGKGMNPIILPPAMGK